MLLTMAFGSRRDFNVPGNWYENLEELLTDWPHLTQVPTFKGDALILQQLALEMPILPLDYHITDLGVIEKVDVTFDYSHLHFIPDRNYFVYAGSKSVGTLDADGNPCHLSLAINGLLSSFPLISHRASLCALSASFLTGDPDLFASFLDKQRLITDQNKISFLLLDRVLSEIWFDIPEILIERNQNPTENLIRWIAGNFTNLQDYLDHEETLMLK